MQSSAPSSRPASAPAPKLEAPTAAFRLYDRNFALAVLSQTCFVMANTLMAHYARWIEFLGGDLRDVGFVMGIGATLGLVLRPWMAQWMDRLGARTMWAIGYVVFGASALSNLLLSDLSPLIYLCRSGLVMGSAIVFASGITYISQATPVPRRAEAIGILGVGGFLGMLIGPFLGDLFLGTQRERTDFVVFFCVAAGANLLPAIILWFMKPSPTSNSKTPIRLSGFLSTIRKYWPGAILAVDLAFGVCLTVPFIFVASFIDRQPLQVGDLSMLGLFFWFYGGIAIFIRLAFRRLPDRVGAFPVLIVGGFVMSAGMFSFVIVGAEHPLWIVIPALLCGSGHALMFHTMMSLTLETFPNEVRGTGSALALMMLDIGTIAGAPVLGAIGDRMGFIVLFISVGCFCGLTTAWYGLRHRGLVSRI